MMVNVGGHNLTIGPNIIARIGILRNVIAFENDAGEDENRTSQKNDKDNVIDAQQSNENQNVDDNVSVQSFTDDVTSAAAAVAHRHRIDDEEEYNDSTLPLFFDEASGCIYIESCPHDFRILLHFLRRGEASLEFIEQHMPYREFLKLFKVYNIATEVKKCRHCLAVYDEDVNRFEPCLRHPGSPVMSNKCAPYWSCCRQPCFNIDVQGKHRSGYGCTSGKHEADNSEDTRSVLERHHDSVLLNHQLAVDKDMERDTQSSFQFCRLGVSPLPHFCKKCPYNPSKNRYDVILNQAENEDGHHVPPCQVSEEMTYLSPCNIKEGNCPLKGSCCDDNINNITEVIEYNATQEEVVEDEIDVNAIAEGGDDRETLTPEFSMNYVKSTVTDSQGSLPDGNQTFDYNNPKRMLNEQFIETPSTTSEIHSNDNDGANNIEESSLKNGTSNPIPTLKMIDESMNKSAQQSPMNSRESDGDGDGDTVELVLELRPSDGGCRNCTMADRCRLTETVSPEERQKNCPLRFMNRYLKDESKTTDIDVTKKEEVEKVIADWTTREKKHREKGKLNTGKSTYKTKFCPLHRLGHCTLPANKCRFAHSAADRRYTEDVYKTQLCLFWKRGKCRAGDYCRHAHGYEELRGRPTPDESNNSMNLAGTSTSNMNMSESAKNIDNSFLISSSNESNFRPTANDKNNGRSNKKNGLDSSLNTTSRSSRRQNGSATKEFNNSMHKVRRQSSSNHNGSSRHYNDENNYNNHDTRTSSFRSSYDNRKPFQNNNHHQQREFKYSYDAMNNYARGRNRRKGLHSEGGKNQHNDHQNHNNSFTSPPRRTPPIARGVSTEDVVGVSSVIRRVSGNGSGNGSKNHVRMYPSGDNHNYGLGMGNIFNVDDEDDVTSLNASVVLSRDPTRCDPFDGFVENSDHEMLRDRGRIPWSSIES